MYDTFSLVTNQQLAFEAVSETKKNVERFRNEYDNLQAEDKYLDKAFRREFPDVSAVMIDALYKVFKKRPKFVIILYIIFMYFILAIMFFLFF